MVERFSELNLVNLGFSGKFMPFKDMREVDDIRKARRELNQLKRDDLQAQMAIKKKNIQEYVEKHEDGLKHAHEAVEHLYDSIKWQISDLQIIKHIIRERYQKDEELMKQGIPPKIGKSLKIGIIHTQQEINRRLRETSDMLGQLTRK